MHVVVEGVHDDVRSMVILVQVVVVVVDAFVAAIGAVGVMLPGAFVVVVGETVAAAAAADPALLQLAPPLLRYHHGLGPSLPEFLMEEVRPDGGEFESRI